MTRFMTREEIQEHLVDQLSWDEQELYQQFIDLSLNRVFIGKIFVIYTLPMVGSVPDVISNLRVTAVNIVEGDIVVSVLDLKTGATSKISYLPELLCGYDIFASVPSECMVMKVFKKNGRGDVIDGGLTAGLLIRHRMKPEFKRTGFVYCLGLSDFKRMFGDDARRAFEKLEMMVRLEEGEG